MTDPWFPDFIAQWYDDFCDAEPYGELDRWRLRGQAIIETWKSKLIGNPHSAAARLDGFVERGKFLSKDERRFHALRVASNVFHDMGFRLIKQFGGKEWDQLRRHWWSTGNLLLNKKGHLLPRHF